MGSSKPRKSKAKKSANELSAAHKRSYEEESFWSEAYVQPAVIQIPIGRSVPRQDLTEDRVRDGVHDASPRSSSGLRPITVIPVSRGSSKKRSRAEVKKCLGSIASDQSLPWRANSFSRSVGIQTRWRRSEVDDRSTLSSNVGNQLMVINEELIEKEQSRRKHGKTAPRKNGKNKFPECHSDSDVDSYIDNMIGCHGRRRNNPPCVDLRFSQLNRFDTPTLTSNNSNDFTRARSSHQTKETLVRFNRLESSCSDRLSVTSTNFITQSRIPTNAFHASPRRDTFHFEHDPVFVGSREIAKHHDSMSKDDQDGRWPSYRDLLNISTSNKFTPDGLRAGRPSVRDDQDETVGHIWNPSMQPSFHFHSSNLNDQSSAIQTPATAPLQTSNRLEPDSSVVPSPCANQRIHPVKSLQQQSSFNEITQQSDQSSSYHLIPIGTLINTQGHPCGGTPTSSHPRGSSNRYETQQILGRTSPSKPGSEPPRHQAHNEQRPLASESPLYSSNFSVFPMLPVKILNQRASLARGDLAVPTTNPPLTQVAYVIAELIGDQAFLPSIPQARSTEEAQEALESKQNFSTKETTSITPREPNDENNTRKDYFVTEQNSIKQMLDSDSLISQRVEIDQHNSWSYSVTNP